MERASGVLLPVSSLWGDYSEGSFGAEARAFVDMLADNGFSVWQVLPFCLPDDCHSPYCSYSAFSGNPNFIDLPTLYREELLTADELAAAQQHTPYRCEFDRLARERMPLLRRAASRFRDWAAVEDFLRQQPEVAAFCRFMALREANGGRPWDQWTCETPDTDALAMWQFAQYTFFTQWVELKAYANARGVRVVGDIPMYVAWDSADVWAAPEQFQLGADRRPAWVAGVPPDYFCEDGQLWGNPLYDWQHMAADGFSWWKARMRAMTTWFDGVRIDHFRGLESYYRIPADAETAREGTWQPGPGMALIEALREVCGDKQLIAEDLGDITPAVRQLVEESGLPGMRVFQFGFLDESDSLHLPHRYPHNAVAYTGTHDNNTLLGYVWELDAETRRRVMAYCGYTGDNWDRGYDAILRTLFVSHAGWLILPLQDLLLYGSDTRLNTPGSSEGNWGWRVTREQMERLDRRKFREWNRLYGRG